MCYPGHVSTVDNPVVVDVAQCVGPGVVIAHVHEPDVPGVVRSGAELIHLQGRSRVVACVQTWAVDELSRRDLAQVVIAQRPWHEQRIVRDVAVDVAAGAVLKTTIADIGTIDTVELLRLVGAYDRIGDACTSYSIDAAADIADNSAVGHRSVSDAETGPMEYIIFAALIFFLRESVFARICAALPHGNRMAQFVGGSFGDTPWVLVY